MEGPGSGLLEDQASFEQCVICLICLSPKLQMVYGSCQHKVCTECLYTNAGKIREVMERCPFCQKSGAFPVSRPDIPEDNITLQRCLGVSICPHSDCGTQLWAWEISDHLVSFHHRSPTRETPCVKKRKTVREEELKVPIGVGNGGELTPNNRIHILRQRHTVPVTRSHRHPRSAQTENPWRS